MPTVDVIDINRQKVGEVELKPEVFAVEGKEHLLQEVVRMQLANRRKGTASTKTISEVSGSNVKPWRQKGTGRARAGHRRSPLWRGGGIVFGPKPRDYAYVVPKKVRRAALRVALSSKVRASQFLVVDRVAVERPKTREVVALLKHLGISGKVLFLLPEIDPNFALAVRNLPGAKALKVEAMNVYDLLYYDQIISPLEAVSQIEEVLSR
ncbi:MAG: 50S ribosomal protein L4 [Candidatus Tectomicrobia bacterium]|uniref:Large ribosomal subunit protein uL4 n=1 Tax=Tectimicrobiota bacterium TaxID=2528274 RepID=A0A932FYS1_UNCTE|nr:50S ribosomal protein L4 [Candidatus Tectomicrobia bacterium]